MNKLQNYLYDLEFCYKQDTSTRLLADVSNLILPSYINNWMESMKIAGYEYHDKLFGEDFGHDHNF